MRLLPIAGLLLALTACAPPQVSKHDPAQADPVPDTKQIKPRTSNYVNITTPKKQVLEERVTINRKDLALLDALTFPAALNNANVIAEDTHVELTRKINVRAQNASIEDYLKQLEGRTDYAITVTGSSSQPTIKLSSTLTKSWDLSALADMPETTTRAGYNATSTSGSGNEDTSIDSDEESSGTKITTERDDNTWSDLIKDARMVLGIQNNSTNTNTNQNTENAVDGEEMSGSTDLMSQIGAIQSGLPGQEANPYTVKPWVIGNKRLGKVTAHGKPSDISRLDAYFKRLVDDSQRQVHISGAILSVTTNSGNGYGIDWSAVYDNGDESFSVTGEATQALSIVDGGSWSVAASVPFGDLTIDALMNSLQEQGSISLQSQPRLTVTNGYTAYLGSTQEFSFVSGIEFLPLTASTDGTASDTAITTTLSRVNVGIKIAVTPKLLDNGKILVNIVPILSSIQGFTEIESAGSVFETPNIALQELATQVITESGTPIYLGGLIINRVIQNTQELPLKNKLLAKALGSAKLETEDSELLIVITPQEVGA